MVDRLYVAHEIELAQYPDGTWGWAVVESHPGWVYSTGLAGTEETRDLAEEAARSALRVALEDNARKHARSASVSVLLKPRESNRFVVGWAREAKTEDEQGSA